MFFFPGNDLEIFKLLGRAQWKVTVAAWRNPIGQKINLQVGRIHRARRIPSMDWFKGEKIPESSILIHISWENRWFPVKIL